MNPININFNRAQNNAAHNQRRPEMNWQHGQTITATLESITNGTATLRIPGEGADKEDVLFHADASALRGQVGDRLTFSVRRTENGYALTQLDERPASTPQRGRATSMDAISDFTQTMESIKETNEYRAEYKEDRKSVV